MFAKKNKTFVSVLVAILTLGLIMAYVPLLFSPSLRPAQVQDTSEPSQTASFTPPAPETTSATTSIVTSTSVSASQTQKISPPEGFSGLQEENNSLNDLNNLLNSDN